MTIKDRPHAIPEPAPATPPEPLTFRIGIAGALVAPLIFLGGVIAFFVVFGVFDMNGLTAAGLGGLLIAALLTKRYSAFWEAVISGISSRSSVTLLLILLSVGMVSAMIGQADVSGGFVWLAGQLGIGGGLFPALVFVMVCVISMATGSSFSAMFTAFPIFYPAGVILGADPVLLAGAIVSGALFGDNLAPISDSTIVSASTQRYRTRTGVAEIGGVVRSRSRYSLPAAGISAVLFLVFGLIAAGNGAAATTGEAQGDPLSLVMVVPIIALLVVAFWKRDIFLAATVGLLTGIVVGLTTGLLTPPDVITANEDGTPGGFLVTGVTDMLPMVGLGIVIFGMIGVLEAAGVFERIVEIVSRSRESLGAVHAELVIGIGAACTAVLFAGVNGASMLMFGPVADRVGARAHLHPFRRANVMDCFTLGIGAVVPIASVFLLISSTLTQSIGGDVPGLTPVTIFGGVFYPLVLTAIMLVSVFTGWGRRFEGADGAELNRSPAAAS
jgi:Na+/H+ antiporter NhaC